MSSKKRRQTMDKLQREQTVKRRRAEKLQKKEDAKIAKAAGLLQDGAGLETDLGDEAPAEASEDQEAVLDQGLVT